MSSSRQNDLQQGEKNSNQTPAKTVLQEPPGITRKERDIVYLTAQIAASCGMHFEQELMRSVSMNPEFEPTFQFMNPTDSRRGFFDEVTLEYTRRLPPPSQYTSGDPSIEPVLEIFFNIVRHVLDHKEETMMDVTYFNDTDSFKPNSQWRPPPVEPIRMRLGFGEYQAPSTIKDDSDHTASLKENISKMILCASSHRVLILRRGRNSRRRRRRRRRGVTGLRCCWAWSWCGLGLRLNCGLRNCRLGHIRVLAQTCWSTWRGVISFSGESFGIVVMRRCLVVRARQRRYGRLCRFRWCFRRRTGVRSGRSS